MKENVLAERLRHFKRKKLLSASQLAELAELPAICMRTLMAQIRALGYLPQRTGGLADENVLAGVPAQF